VKAKDYIDKIYILGGDNTFSLKDVIVLMEGFKELELDEYKNELKVNEESEE